MASARKWSQVAVAMQSALGASLTINSLTKAVGGVVTTSSAHGLSNGDFVVLAVQGMWQVNDRVFRVSSASGSVFTLEGEDTTNYDTFSSGTAQKITFGTSVTSATTLTSSGGNFAMIDTTTSVLTRVSKVRREIKRTYIRPPLAGAAFSSTYEDVMLQAVRTPHDHRLFFAQAQPMRGRSGSE